MKYGFSGQTILFGGFAQNLNAAAITQPRLASHRIAYLTLERGYLTKR